MKKVVSLLLALAMLLGVCSLAAAEEEPITLTLLMQAEDKIPDMETNHFTIWLQEQIKKDLGLNVNLDFMLLPKDGLTDKITLMLMSGEPLPDVINYLVGSGSMATTYKWAQSGRILCLDDYYANPEYNANFEKAKEIVPDLFNYVVAPDGHYYSIPRYQRELHNTQKNKLWINTHWLDELGLSTPTTLDEFHDVLVAFKEAHPGCYPILPYDNGWQGDFVLWISNSFIYNDDKDHLIFTDDGLSVCYIDDAFKEALLYVRGLVDEGLVPVECFTMKDNTFTEILQNGDANGECCIGGFLNAANNKFTTETPWWPWFDGLEPLVGPTGLSYALYNQPTADNCWFITEDCKNPDVAFKVGAYIFDPTENVWRTGRYGEEGVDWEQPTRPDSVYGEGFPAMFIQHGDMWASSDNKIWRNNFPGFDYLCDQGMMETGDPTDWVHKIPQAVARIAPHQPKAGEYVPALIYTEEEADQINTIRTDLSSYYKECKTLFVTRQMSIEDEWDSFVQECWDMGLQEFLDVSWTAYNRMFGDK